MSQHHPFDEREAQNRLTILKWLEETNDPFNSKCYDPGHVTGSACIFCQRTKSIVLIYNRHLKRWIQPGGHSEPEEQKILRSIIREVSEETGIILTEEDSFLFDLDVHKVPPCDQQPTHTHFDFRYLWLVDEQPIIAASDALECRWEPIATASALVQDVGLERMLLKCEKLLVQETRGEQNG